MNMVDISNNIGHNTLDMFLLGDAQVDLKNIDGQRLTGFMKEITDFQ